MALGCSIRIIAVDIAEIAMAVDQRVALGKILGKSHQRVVDRLVTMRVELADHVADDARAFLAGRAGVEAKQAHGVEEPPMHGLEPVPRVGKRAIHDRRERIGEVALLQRRPQRNVVNLGGIGGNQYVAHKGWLTRRESGNNSGSDRNRLVPPPPGLAVARVLRIRMKYPNFFAPVHGIPINFV